MPDPATSWLDQTLEILEQRAPKLGLRARGMVQKRDALYRERAEAFFGRYARFLAQRGIDFADGVGSFIRLQDIVEQERVKFLSTGQYPSTNFAEVNERFYSNPELMRHHMHGLVFAQFLWPEQYERFHFFSSNLGQLGAGVKDYLEVGGGHALYLCEAQRLLGHQASIQVVEISQTSMDIAQSFANSSDIQFFLMNIFDFPDAPAFDFITMGEVLEHVEQPRELLIKLRQLLRPGGRAYITTPANAPMPDHIYLFHNAGEIRQMLEECGFRIELERSCYAVDVPESVGQKLKLPLMYAAFVTPA